MVFVFGGEYAGKERFAVSKFGEGAEIIRDIHLFVRDRMKDGKDALAETGALLELHPDAVFITNEIGCGIVPADDFERGWREQAGRVSCMLAEKADEVYRVVCGIGIKLK